MDMSQITNAQEQHRAGVLNTITLAFVADPFMRWMLPGADAYLQYFPDVSNVYGGLSIDEGSCYMTSGGEGAALWLPPGVSPDEEKMVALIDEAVAPERQETLGRVLEAMDSYRPEDDDCWYLAIIGVDAGHQGKGIGGALMKHVTTMLDENHYLGYLESSNPMNISLYMRHGFEVMDEIRIGDAPVITPMIRQRR
jgi:GNAT superfamily N-acetyltransferase